MNSSREDGRVRHAAAGPVCPACREPVAVAAQLCASCGFTGGDTMTMFSDPAPPFMPVLDAAGIWNHDDVRKIEAARRKLRGSHPQFHWHVCSVMLPPGTSLPLFGFWMLNACPLYAGETEQERAWAVLLLIDAATGCAAVIPGYSAEPWLGDADWTAALSAMSVSWQAGDAGGAVLRFFETSARLLNRSWKKRGLRQSERSHS